MKLRYLVESCGTFISYLGEIMYDNTKFKDCNADDYIIRIGEVIL